MRRAGLLSAVLGALLLLSTAPAGAKLFTLDSNDNDVNDLDGSDDLAFSFMGSDGLVSGVIRAVDVTVSAPLLQGSVENYVDFSGGTVPLQFGNMDVLIFDVVLDAGSALIDEIIVSVGTDPLGLDPDGAGFFTGCDPGVPLGCRSNVDGGGEKPQQIKDIYLDSGLNVFPGSAIFEYHILNNDKKKPKTGNLSGGETSRRLFVAWEDTGPQSPLSKVGQIANFTFGSGSSFETFTSAIVPEPGTAGLLGLGVTLLASARRRAAAR